MSLLALLLALALERGFTHLLHLREPRWLDRYFDWAAGGPGGRPGAVHEAAAVLTVLGPVLPVAALSWFLGSHLLGLPQFAFAVLVLFFSFGPRDLKDEVDDYIDALERGDRDESTRRANELLEGDAAGRGAGLRVAVEEAVFVQANNRVFGVIFWFVLLGPAGAWAFRVSDLLRRRSAFESHRRGRELDAAETAADAGAAAGADVFGRGLGFVHGLLAWVPARLAAASYALAGSFEDAVGNWRAAVGQASDRLLDRSEDLLARVGKGSLQPSLVEVPAAQLDVATARGAWRIVSRAVWTWIVVVAVLVLLGGMA